MVKQTDFHLFRAMVEMTNQVLNTFDNMCWIESGHYHLFDTFLKLWVQRQYNFFFPFLLATCWRSQGLITNSCQRHLLFSVNGYSTDVKWCKDRKKQRSFYKNMDYFLTTFHSTWAFLAMMYVFSFLWKTV